MIRSNLSSAPGVNACCVCQQNVSLDMFNMSELEYENISVSSMNNEIFLETLLNFKIFWNHLLSVYLPLEFAVMCIGLLGNVIALTTLILSTKMRTPSFVYHRALVGADLVFCINFFLNYITDRWLTVNSANCENMEQVQYVFRYWIAAFYSGIVYVALKNICGFLIIYVTLIIALDRALALLFFKHYHYWNHRGVAFVAVAIAFGLSISLNSWASFLERFVVSYRLNVDQNPLFRSPCWNETLVYHWELRENLTSTCLDALKIRNGYNSAIRIVYPILLSILTTGVFYGLAKRQKRRRRNRSRVTGAFLTVRNPVENSVSITATSAMGNNNSLTGTIRPRVTHRTKAVSERMLFLLMIAVAALAFLHVTAGEAKRLLLLLFPPDVLLREKVANTNLSLQERLWYFRFVLYGQQISRLIANICTAIDRSCICIFYVAMNKLFRHEALFLMKRIYRKCFCPIWILERRRGWRRGRRESRFRLDEIDPANANELDLFNSATLQNGSTRLTSVDGQL